MLGMSLLSFLVLSLIGAVVACVYQFAFHYRFLEGTGALFGKLVVGWVGGWLGSPVLGHWLWEVENVRVVPAILGAIATIHMNHLAWTALAKLVSARPEAQEARRMKTAA
jgi:uncharacterized membrane protein YeaQ/YmgE (transglycosylase-associated protein family)